MIENFVHQLLVGCSGIFEDKRHNFVKIIGVVCDEGGLVHVGCSRGDLIVTEICIQETEYVISRRVVNKSVNLG